MPTFTNTPAITIKNGQLITTSQAISHHFGKAHKDIIRAINNLECSHDFNQRNFAPVKYKAGNGEMRPSYETTKDGFMFLVMGFTGKAAAKWKEAFIAEFNRMEQQLHGQLQAKLMGHQRQTQKLVNAFLESNPLYSQIVRYSQLGLNPTEIGKLCDLNSEPLRRELNKLASFELVDPPARTSVFGRCHFNEEQIQVMAQMRHNGRSFEGIAKHFGCHRDTVRRRLNALNKEVAHA